MPWKLDTPIAVGDLDPNGAYNEIKIIQQTHDSVEGTITVVFNYGNTVNGEWISGIGSPPGAETSHTIHGEDYLLFVSTHIPNEEELTYIAVKRGLYEYLYDHSKIPNGVIT